MNNDLIGRNMKGRYRLIDERGNGNFGTVYIARDLLTNYVYAAKVLNLDYAFDAELLERFKREAYILQSLNDPHIVRLVDYGNDEAIYFIIMHHVDGQNLKWYVTTYGPMELPRAINYILQAAKGLDAAFKKGVVHRDIKPQNLLVSNKGVVKIADFGLSRSADAPTITSSDKFMGTAYYSAPEQVESGHTADIRADLYSLAVVFFEILAGHPPYTGGTVVEIILKHRDDPIPSIRRFRPDLPPEVDIFFQRALAKSPYSRFQTPREFIEALEELDQRLRGPAVRQPEARLTVLTTGQTFNLVGEVLVVGREDPKREFRPDIQIDDQTFTVGRQHARLIHRQGAWLLEDNKSRNKTRLNGEILAPYEARPLKDGDILMFGRIEARFELR
ncbi:MAG TPA: FHA domain-containing serine/threonine-protein kinase [Ktedonobacteraceae bacterium]|jgi:serine/threonine-protein kinase|nr:FHA domain-containing serine/threonine-protein kinase [Ktedonobacteraceae bacterium]